MHFDLPDKLIFKRKEVVSLTKLDGKVLDFWEKEFNNIKPVVSRTGDKSYTRKDVETILTIKQMLVVERLDKSEIKKRLGNSGEQETAPPANIDPGKYDNGKLEKIKNSLKEILILLEKKPKK